MELDFSNNNIDYSLGHITISKCLELLQKPFDRDGIAKRTYEKNFNNPNSKYYQMEVSQIIESWEEKAADSRHYGKLLDDYIGLNLNKDSESTMMLWKMNNSFEYDERLQNVCKSFDDFYALLSKSGDTEFITREKPVYYKIKVDDPCGSGISIDYYVTGRFDALFRNKKTGKWIIIDWKSSGEIDKNVMPYTDKLLGPMFKFPALNWYTYTTQGYFYKKALIENYLPNGTTIDDVEFLIVQLPGRVLDDSGQMFKIHKPAYPYDDNLMNRIFNFCIIKTILMNNEHNQA